MKSLNNYLNESYEIINEGKSSEINEQNILAIICAFKCLVDDSSYYTGELRTYHLKPTISTEQAFEAAKIILNQTIWDIDITEKNK